MSSADTWRRVEEVLEVALETSTADRPALLDRICQGDDALRRAVEALLAADRITDGFLETSADAMAAAILGSHAPDPDHESADTMIGPYRLCEEIGRGGMGKVWLAARADGQFEQRVAVKLIKRGMDTDEILGRFLRERQILARLESPNIARLLDGGVSEDGRPYFVMEYVRGLPITDHCIRRDLPIEQRLRLFVIACRAVSYAHRNLVVHRDLKPSNVLVTEAGEVKLLDFGIAKVTGEDDALAVTREVKVMTPEYASPEQRAGGAVTTSSDVYQLGALLYELITGDRVQSGARKRLGGDLELIVARALRDEPEARYPSAEDLAEDVDRHVADLPIRFGGDHFSYRARKFARRHRLTVALGAGVLALLVTLVSFYTLQLRAERDRAQRELAKSIEAAQLTGRFFQSWNPDSRGGVEVTAVKVVADAAVHATRELRDDPEMLSATLSILGDLQTSLGQWDAADSLLTRALSIQERLYREPTPDLALTAGRRGRLLSLRGEYETAESALRHALALDRKLLGPGHHETLRVQRELAALLHRKRQLREAEVLLRGILAAMPERDHATSPLALEAASWLGYALFDQARYEESIAILRTTLARQRALFGETHQPTLLTMRFLASALRDSGRLSEAESLYRTALRTSHALYGAEHVETAGSMLVLAIVLERTENLAEAELLARAAVKIYEGRYGTNNFATATIWVGLAGILLDRGNATEAEDILRRTHRVYRRSFPAGHQDEGDILNRLAFILVARGAADADSIYRQAVRFDDARAPDSPVFVTDGFHYLAWARQQKGDLDGAERDYRRAVKLYEAQLPEGHSYRVAATTGLKDVMAERAKTSSTRP